MNFICYLIVTMLCVHTHTKMLLDQILLNVHISLVFSLQLVLDAKIHFVFSLFLLHLNSY